MLCILLHKEFNHWFDGNCTSVKNGTYTQSNNYCVEYCFFEDLNNRAVYSSGFSKFLIEYCTFVSVSNPSDHGGAVYTLRGMFVHNRICSFNCSAPNYGQYCFSQVYLSENYDMESSVSRSSGEAIGDSPIHLEFGIDYLTKTNISYFKTNSICGYVISSGI